MALRLAGALSAVRDRIHYVARLKERSLLALLRPVADSIRLSYELLDARSKEFFSAFSAFLGDFTEDAAAAAGR